MKQFYPWAPRALLLLALSASAACNKTPSPAPDPAALPPVTVRTLAGSTVGAEGYADGPGPDARFNLPTDVVVNAEGTVYLLDYRNEAIRQTTPAGVVTTLAVLPDLKCLAIDAAGLLYAAREGTYPLATVRRDGQLGRLPGEAASYPFYYPQSLAVGPDGTVYVGEPSRILAVSPAGDVTTLAGHPTRTGYVNGPGVDARFNVVSNLAVDAQGTVYASDARETVLKITPAGVVTTLAGGGAGPADDGVGPAARFQAIYGLMADAGGVLYAADGPRVRRITPDGTVRTLVGGAAGYRDGPGAGAAFTPLYSIGGRLATTGLYVTEAGRVRHITTP